MPKTLTFAPAIGRPLRLHEPAANRPLGAQGQRDRRALMPRCELNPIQSMSRGESNDIPGEDAPTRLGNLRKARRLDTLETEPPLGIGSRCRQRVREFLATDQLLELFRPHAPHPKDRPLAEDHGRPGDRLATRVDNRA